MYLSQNLWWFSFHVYVIAWRASCILNIRNTSWETLMCCPDISLYIWQLKKIGSPSEVSSFWLLHIILHKKWVPVVHRASRTEETMWISSSLGSNQICKSEHHKHHKQNETFDFVSYTRWRCFCVFVSQCLSLYISLSSSVFFFLSHFYFFVWGDDVLSLLDASCQCSTLDMPYHWDTFGAHPHFLRILFCSLHQNRDKLSVS